MTSKDAKTVETMEITSWYLMDHQEQVKLNHLRMLCGLWESHQPYATAQIKLMSKSS